MQGGSENRALAEKLEKLAAVGRLGDLGAAVDRLARAGACEAFLRLALGLPVPDPPARIRWRDDRLWWALATGRPEVAAEEFACARGGAGPLFPDSAAIEVWTERDLCGLHALSRMAERDPTLAPAVERVALWHVENTQPDNATNRPWSAHVFFALGAARAGAEMRLFGETLLHNSMVSMGEPDDLSRVILLDAANGLRGAAAWIDAAQ